VLAEVAERLDAWVVERNLEARAEGMLTLPPCTIHLLGQSALLEVEAPLTLAVTNDVDVRADYLYPIEAELRRMLEQAGKELDPFGQEIWMPRETQYKVLFAGEFVTLKVADVEAILISKALKAPRKNRALIVEYLARGATLRFMRLARKYRVDLESFL
jgi:hypothetical protein